MAQSELGELKRVDVKNYWPNESSNFTPWLAANIDQIGKAIGMSLEVVETEKAVGRYSADIYARNEDDTMVVIENQYGPTDHDHLGKALTYAAGLSAKTVVWISEKFGSEHLATLNWLNSITGDELAFFGVEVQLWKIGNSPLAPRFEVVSKPNRFADTLKARVTHGQLTPGQRLQLEFWQAYALSIESEALPFKSGKPGPRNWFIHTIGEGNVYLQGIASTWNSDSNSYDGGG